MASKRSPSKRLKELAAEIPPERAIHAQLTALERLDGVGDHALALVGASFVEKALETAILSRLIPLNEEDRKRLFDYQFGGPLCDLAGRIQMARAMGIFGANTFDDLERIRQVRNAFAHSLWHITFATAEVADMCDFHATRRIRSARATIAGGTVAGANQRAKYMHAVRFIAGALKHRIPEAGLAPSFMLPRPDPRLP